MPSRHINRFRSIQTGLLLILAVLAFASTGCRVDKASKSASSLDATNGDPGHLATRPSPTPAPAPQPAETPAPVNDPRPTLVCFGDSLTAGFGTDSGQSYPDYLQALLDARGYHYRVVNRGVSGNTTKDGLNRVDSVLALHPAVVVVEFGGNDGLRGLPIADSRANLDKILATLQASGTKIVIAGITLPPDYGPDYIHQFTETYQVLAKKYRVPLLPFLLDGVYGIPGMMQADGTHATAAGNKIVATKVLPYVTPLLKK